MMLYLYFAGNRDFPPRFVCLLLTCLRAHMFTIFLCFSLDGVKGDLLDPIKEAFQTLLKMADAVIPPGYVSAEPTTVG